MSLKFFIFLKINRIQRSHDEQKKLKTLVNKSPKSQLEKKPQGNNGHRKVTDVRIFCRLWVKKFQAKDLDGIREVMRKA